MSKFTITGLLGTHDPVPQNYITLDCIDCSPELPGEAKRRTRNRARIAEAIVPKSCDDVRVGDLVVPLEEDWYRGPGLVDEIDASGCVWAVFGPCEGSDLKSDSVRCYMPWTEVRIVESASAEGTQR